MDAVEMVVSCWDHQQGAMPTIDWLAEGLVPKNSDQHVPAMQDHIVYTADPGVTGAVPIEA